MIGVYLAGFLIRGLRWHYMLLPIKNIRTRATTEGVIIGYMANNLFPARAGEVVRAMMLGSRGSISKASALGTIAVERIFDGAAIVGILVVCSFFFTTEIPGGTFLVPVIVFGTGIFGAGCLLILLGYSQLNRVKKILRVFCRRLPERFAPKVEKVGLNLLDSLKFLSFSRHLHVVLMLSILIWVIEGLVFWVGFIAFGLEANFLAAYMTLALVNLAMLVPSAPGGVGLFQQGNILAFSLFGISIEKALSYSVVVHGAMIVPVTLLGLVILSRCGLSFMKMKGEGVTSPLESAAAKPRIKTAMDGT